MSGTFPGSAESRPSAQLRRPSGSICRPSCGWRNSTRGKTMWRLQQRQQLDLDLGAFGLDQVRVLRPLGIGELDAVGQDARGAPYLDVEAAG